MWIFFIQAFDTYKFVFRKTGEKIVFLLAIIWRGFNIFLFHFYFVKIYFHSS